MVKHHARKSRVLRKKHRGGGTGNIVAFTGVPIMPGLGNAAVNQAQSSCLAADSFGRASASPTGLPGQFGGRYGFDLTQQIAPGTPFLGGIPPVVSIPCEGHYANPLNPSTGAPYQQNLPQRGGVGGIDSAFYAAPTAGYTQNPSTWVGSTGSPALLSIPYAAGGTPSMNPACLKTGGGRTRGTGRKGRKGRKSKATRRR
jgi:hypothetical protein